MCLEGIYCSKESFPEIPQYAIFDTAYHNTLPAYASQYALPESISKNLPIKRYGFHGISHQYVANETARLLGKQLENLNLISLHLGNGCSITAIRQGLSVDTSMGFTPLEGLVMGSRCGDIDPGIIIYLLNKGWSKDDVETLLSHNSGLEALCTSDMRVILERYNSGDKRAQLAVDVFCYRIKKYIGAYYAVLGGINAVVFTGGIGQHAPLIRDHCLAGLEGFGLQLDTLKNEVSARSRAVFVQQVLSDIPIIVIPTDEQKAMARESWYCSTRLRLGI